MKKIEMDIVALSHSVTQSNNYAVVLGERDGMRRLPVVIGAFEAQAIAVAIEEMNPNRPLTHDLFKNTLETFHIDLKEVVINNLVEGIFYARLICLKDNELIEIDSRTSDAIALAVRFQCPIFTYDFILDTAGVILEESEEEEAPPQPRTPSRSRSRRRSRGDESGSSLSSYTEEDLTRMLDEVLAAEDYERAAKIRDELNRRK